LLNKYSMQSTVVLRLPSPFKSKQRVFSSTRKVERSGTLGGKTYIFQTADEMSRDLKFLKRRCFQEQFTRKAAVWIRNSLFQTVSKRAFILEENKEEEEEDILVNF